MSASDPSDIKRVVTINSNIGTSCDHCGESIGLDRVKESINHYLEHGYRLLHVGQESQPSSEDGRPYHTTVAVLGSDNPPPTVAPAGVVRFVNVEPK